MRTPPLAGRARPRRSGLVAGPLIAVMDHARQQARDAFAQAGEKFATLAKERREELEDAMFGELQKLPLSDRIAMSKEEPAHLRKLLQQAQDSNDAELASLVFLSAHVSDYPEVRD